MTVASVMQMLVGILFLGGALVLWKPKIAERLGGKRWHGGVALGLAVVLSLIGPNPSEDVMEVRTPTQPVTVRTGPGLAHDEDPEVGQVEQGDRLHIVGEEDGWVQFRTNAGDDTWHGWVSKQRTTTYAAHQAEQDSLAKVQEEQRKAQREEETRRMDAWMTSQEFVKRRLKSPSTAEFSSQSNTSVTKVDSLTYRVRGHVDAQNSFGAMLRNQYVVTMRSSGDTWELLDISMD